MTSSGTIEYERLAQNAKRGVIREILKETEKSGLPGEHHFYIQFETHGAGVNISKRLRQRYPDEMTIVLQHRFWDLAVHDDYFEVKLTFDSIPERLVVPFSAIKVFFDPSVRYALQFENLDMAETLERDRDENSGGDDVPVTGPRGLAAVEPSPIARIDRPAAGGVPTLVALTSSDNGDTPDDRLAEERDAELAETLEDVLDLDELANSGDTADEDAHEADEPEVTGEAGPDKEAEEEAGSGVVVSLDAFRKK